VTARHTPPVTVPVRVTTVAAVVVVALVAAVVSYSHMQEVAHRAGEAWRSYLVPLSVDGLVVAASMMLLTRRRAGLPGGWLAWPALLAGVGASLAANMAAAEATVTARLVAAWTQKPALNTALEHLPGLMDRSWALDWSTALPALASGYGTGADASSQPYRGAVASARCGFQGQWRCGVSFRNQGLAWPQRDRLIIVRGVTGRMDW